MDLTHMIKVEILNGQLCFVICITEVMQNTISKGM